MTLAAKIRAELLIGPSTAQELGAIMETCVRQIGHFLYALENYGHVEIFGLMEVEKGKPGRPAPIYQLTRKGRRIAMDAAHISFSMHTVPVSVRQTQSHVRPVAAISGVKRLNKPLKPLQAGCGFDGQDAALQTIIPAALVSMGKTGEVA